LGLMVVVLLLLVVMMAIERVVEEGIILVG
jgi:hypothetical protein